MERSLIDFRTTWLFDIRMESKIELSCFGNIRQYTRDGLVLLIRYDNNSYEIYDIVRVYSRKSADNSYQFQAHSCI